MDWWSLGVTVCELCSGRRPFNIHSGTGADATVAVIAARFSAQPGNAFNANQHERNFSQEFVK